MELLMSKQLKPHLSFTVLGSNSGRNAGDAAILASLMRTLSEEIGPDVRFEVPTTNPAFVSNNYGRLFNVRPISIMPWTGSLRLLGIPTFRSIARTDAMLITDGIIFDVKLWNPIFNFLITLIFLAPWAKLLGKKVICYNVGIGPLRSYWGQRFARFLGNLSDLIIVREEDSLALFRKIGVKKEIHLMADAVFQNWAASDERKQQILAETGLTEAAASNNILGINVTRYVDSWLAESEKLQNKDDFINMLASSLVQLKRQASLEPVIVITQVMDHAYGERLRQLTSEKYFSETKEKWAPRIVSNVKYNNHEILAFCSCCRVFAGMRLHSLIIASRAGTPIVGLVYAPKVKSFLTQLKTPKQAIELAGLKQETLVASLLSVWNDAERLRAGQQTIVENLAYKARQAAILVADTMGLAQPSTQSQARPLVSNS